MGTWLLETLGCMALSVLVLYVLVWAAEGLSRVLRGKRR